MAWQVRNQGDLDWHPATTRFTYLSGTWMHVSPSTSLQGPFAHGAEVLLVADMVAPGQPGTYRTVWSLWQG